MARHCFGLPTKFADSTVALDIASELDNEPIQLAVSFRDRMHTAFRTRFLAEFGSYENYLNATREEVERWTKQMRKTLARVGSTSTVGAYKALVAQPPELYDKYLRVIEGGLRPLSWIPKGGRRRSSRRRGSSRRSLQASMKSRA